MKTKRGAGSCCPLGRLSSTLFPWYASYTKRTWLIIATPLATMIRRERLEKSLPALACAARKAFLSIFSCRSLRSFLSRVVGPKSTRAWSAWNWRSCREASRDARFSSCSRFRLRRASFVMPANPSSPLDPCSAICSAKVWLVHLTSRTSVA